jgi:hypothetical protein
MFQFFQKTPKCKLLALICLKYSQTHIQLSSKVHTSCCLVRCSMSYYEEERRVKARLGRDVSKFYQRRSFKRTMSQKELPKGDLIIGDMPNPNSSSDSSDDDVEDDTYIPSSRAHSQGKGKEVADASGSGARNEDAKAESHDEGSGNDDDDEVEGTFDVEEIAPSYYMHMGAPIFRQPQNLDWREKISYKRKIELVREKRK